MFLHRRAGRSALDLYEPLRAQLESQRVSSIAGALVDELAEEFVLGFLAVHKSNCRGLLNHGLHAIDATSGRWLGGEISSPRKDFVKNYRVHLTH